MGDLEDYFPPKEKKKPYPSARKLARSADAGHARREKKKRK